MSPSWWNIETSGWAKLVLAAAALLLVGWAEWARNTKTPKSDVWGATWRPRLIGLLGVLGFAAYFNFGSFNFQDAYLHRWDAAHYVLGARYFDELGYDGLYECIAVADAEVPGQAARVATRAIIDLGTNRLTTAAQAVVHPEQCKHRFSPQRWTEFSADVAFFRSDFPEDAWEQMSTDHGFNAPPAWLLLAHPLAGTGALTWAGVKALAVLDPVLILGALLATAWLCGGWTAALVAIVLGTYFPGQLLWTGGSFLRWDWLAALLVGLALCRRNRPVLGGALLGWATLLRIFPGFALVGVLLNLIMARVRRKPVDPAGPRILLSALAVVLIMGTVSGALRREHAWGDFVRNMRKHTAVASGNRMGLASLLAYDAQARAEALRPTVGEDPRTRWERAQSETLHARRWLWLVLGVLGTTAIAACVRDQPAWLSALLGLLLVPLGTPIACYYYVYLAVLALFAESRREVGGLLLALAIASLLVARLSHFDMDEQYVAQSLIVIMTLVFVASAFLSRRKKSPEKPTS